MNSRIPRLERSLDRFSHALGMSVGLVVLLITVLIAYGVAVREVFRYSDTWVTEATTYLMGYVAFVGAGHVLWSGRHVRVELLPAHAGPRVRAVLFVIVNTILAMVALLLVFLSFNFMRDAWNDGEKSWGTFAIPLWMPYAMFFAGTVIFLCLHLLRTVIDWHKMHSQHPAAAHAGIERVSVDNSTVKG